ncbi:ABC transporter ATP-binding protein (plasmid) [Bacillus cereus]|uniref:ABC transporter ATP-binding protein n=1 Tax=Bacillus cereus TaxID=1396 RepID=A0AB73USZ9_BACCE|nr:ABC transporter ATP-binding protein [Bacillus cereus]HDR3523476.1 ABC transporter ATP-binding protein [Bacillus pacificus]QHV07969.1 ABC transporter ATP-binding protein [Bacillus cereus]QHV47429.1 ABC transporter ATP-binding protein [Bacillus cereus]HDR3634033.1 ABC transporter ATP-binding protein [Bacillus pacificus]HDR7652969.1 ABC transporter ATP-binding protein [Bacillus pacificus]
MKLHNSNDTQSLSLIKLYKWFFSYLTSSRSLFLLFIICSLLSNAIIIVIPKFVQIFVDQILPAKDQKMFIILLCVIVIIVSLMFIINSKKNILALKFHEKAVQDIQTSSFRQLRRLGFSYFEQHSVGETLSYFQTDIPTIQEIYRSHLPSIIESTFMLIFSLFFLTTINAQLALIFIPCSIFYFLSGPYFEKKGVKYIREYYEWVKKIDEKQFVSLSALLDLRVFHAEKWDLKKLSVFIEKAGKAIFLHLVYINLYAMMRRIAVYSGAIILFFYGYYLIQKNQLTNGEFISFLMLYFHVMFTITYLVTRISKQNALIRSAEKLFEFLHLTPTVHDSQNPKILSEIKGDIGFHNVHFQYSLHKQILDGINIHIKPGERVCIVGVSGSGKSTLTKLLGRFYNPIQGEIYIDGVPIDQLSFEQLRNTIGYVFQETYLFGTSVKENIRFGNPDATDEQVIAAATAAYAHEYIMKLPEGYDTLIGERGVKLSGGQKQRIAIARMLLKNPKIVILDEATSALDNESEGEVNEAMKRLLDGRTTICVAHRESTIRQYELIYVLEHGKIVEMGDYPSLLEQKGKFFKLIQEKEGS